MFDDRFIEFGELLALASLEAEYAAGIVSGCSGCVTTERKGNDVCIISIKFSRFNWREEFYLEVDLRGKYFLSVIKEKLEYFCREAVCRLGNESYRNENILERSEDSAED